MAGATSWSSKPVVWPMMLMLWPYELATPPFFPFSTRTWAHLSGHTAAAGPSVCLDKSAHAAGPLSYTKPAMASKARHAKAQRLMAEEAAV